MWVSQCCGDRILISGDGIPVSIMSIKGHVNVMGVGEGTLGGIVQNVEVEGRNLVSREEANEVTKFVGGVELIAVLYRGIHLCPCFLTLPALEGGFQLSYLC